jgi:hypothetical protein
MNITGRIYALFAWLIVAIGTLHMIATFCLSAGSSLGKVWFFGSGLAIALVGAHRYRRRDNIGRQSGATSNYLVAFRRRLDSVVFAAVPRR